MIQKIKYTLLLLLTLACIVSGNRAYAQRLDAIGKEEPLTVSGNISTNFILYGSNGESYGRDRFTSYISGSMNFDLYGVAMPLSFSYSSQSTGSFQQPFNQVAIHPSYKWVTAHIGFTSMSFSSHSLSGHTFSGVGFDITPPGRFKVSTMVGRLVKPIKAPEEALDDIPAVEVVPAYARWGGGAKVSYALDKHAFDLIIFKAKDDAGSIPSPASSYNLTPKDNLVLGINVSSRITSKLSARLEFTASALTNNTKISKDSTEKSAVPDLGFLLHTNGSTALYKALKSGVDYSFGQSTVGIGYERIDPEYQTLGAYYTTNDLENITANFGTSLFKGKAQLAFNVGKQRDNLNNNKASSFTNWVWSGNAAVTPIVKLSLNLSYSSFQAYTHLRSAYEESIKLTPYDNLDTLKFTQISQNMAVSAAYRISADKERVQMLNISLNGVLTHETQGDSTTSGNGGMYNGILGYSLSLVPIKTTLNVGLNASFNDIAMSKSFMLGPTVAVGKGFLDGKLNTNMGVSYSLLKAKGATAGSVLNTRLGASYGISGKKEKSFATHQLGLSAVFSNRFKSSANAKAFADFTITFSYTCSFLPQKYWLGTKKKEKSKEPDGN